MFESTESLLDFDLSKVYSGTLEGKRIHHYYYYSPPPHLPLPFQSNQMSFGIGDFRQNCDEISVGYTSMKKERAPRARHTTNLDMLILSGALADANVWLRSQF